MLVHDAARPLATAELVDRVLAGLVDADGAVPGVPVADTVKRVARAVWRRRSTARSLVAVQTPQAFRADALRAAYAGASDLGCGDRLRQLVEAAGLPVAVVDGDPRNIKVTTASDLERAEGELAAVILDYHMHLVDDDDPYTDEILSEDRVGEYVSGCRAGGGRRDRLHRPRLPVHGRPRLARPPAVDGGRRQRPGGRTTAAVSAARDAGMPVKVGLEVDYLDGREDAIRAALDPFEWDFLLGSVHWIDGLAVDWDAAPVWERHAAAEVWEMYVDALCAAAQSGIYDSMAHPDLAKVFGNRPEPKPMRLYERIADCFQAAGVCAEVSTGGFGARWARSTRTPSCSPCSASAACR